MEAYDFIVVGSGAAGGLLAHHLFEAGAKCLLLEAGKFYRAETFPRTEAEYASQLFWGGGLEFDNTVSMVFLRGKCVGGTTVVNQALLDRFDGVALSDWRTASGVDFFTPEALAPYYERVERQLELQQFSESHFNRNARLFVQGCDRLGYRWERLRRAQHDCALEEGNDCIGCLGGCHRDSKQSTLVAFIQKAEKKGLEIVPECVVETVEPGRDRVRVHAVRNGRQKQTWAAQKVILAAAPFGTVKILFDSGFGKRLPALGKHFSTHPQFMSFGVFDEPVDAHKGAFQTVASKDPRFRQQGFKLENVFAPPISLAMLFEGLGRRHQEIMKRYRYLACIEVAIRDEAVGEIRVDRKGRLVVKKPLTDADRRRRDAGLQVVQAIFEAAGAREVVHARHYFGLHLMGGCAMGRDPETSVVNEAFQVHDVPNLYVADASVFPNAPGINPSLTVMALAEKLSEALGA